MLTDNPWGFWQLIEFFGPKVFFSILCGAIIGLEREMKNKPAGIKTNILICFGSTLFTATSVLISASQSSAGHFGDPGRLAAQIVSGIGFIGGGAIIQARGTILGLTTAATMWVVSAIGICIGIGHWDLGLACAIMVVLVLVGTTYFEDRILGRSLSFQCEVVVDDPEGKVRGAINEALVRNDLNLADFDITEKGPFSLLTLKYSGHRVNHKRFILELWATSGIKEVHQR